MDYERYIRIEHLCTRYGFLSETKILKFLEIIKCIKFNGCKFEIIPEDKGLHLCRDGEERVNYTSYNDDHWVLEETWVDFMRNNTIHRLNAVKKINNL